MVLEFEAFKIVKTDEEAKAALPDYITFLQAKLGIDYSDAAHRADHELNHSLLDTGKHNDYAALGVASDSETGELSAAYAQTARPAAVQLNISLANPTEMSCSDIANAQMAFTQLIIDALQNSQDI